MIEHNAQQPGTNPSNMESDTPEEGSELVEEADQRGQEIYIRHFLRNERIRLVIICIGLLAIILSAVLFLFTGTSVVLFVTIVIVPLFYRSVDVYLGKSEVDIC